MSIHQVKVKVQFFLDKQLYSNIDNKDKIKMYNNLLIETKNLEVLYCTQDEKLLLSYLHEIPEINMYSIPYVSIVLKKFIKNYNTYFGTSTNTEFGPI